MECASCGKANRAGARFCGGCGAPLVLRCDSCGAEREADAKFCDTCGNAYAAAPAQAAPGTRKVVTVLFTDLAGSTSLHERTDAEAVRRLMQQYYAAVRTAIEMHQGTVVKLIGDGVMAVFGVPHVAEDDALRAVHAAVAAQDAFNRLAEDVADRLGSLSMRVGINTGEVVVSEADDDVVGDPVNVAARLEHAAPDGGVLIGEATRRLVHEKVTLASAGELALKGRADPVPAYRVVSLQPPDDTRTTVFVGRDRELERLLAVYDDAAGGARARLAMVIGSPGLGKSRLLAELTRDLDSRATVLFGRCDHAGGGTFAPLADALRLLTGLDESAPADTARAAIADLIAEEEPERDRIVTGVASLLGGSAPSTEEAFWSVRRFLATLGRSRPVVLTLDDLHWAEPLLLDLIGHLIEWSGDVPLFVLGAARPELRDARSSLTVAGGIVTDVVTLDGLDARAATRLAADVIGTEQLPAAVAGHVLAASEGNPLYLRELVRMLVEDGAVVQSGEQWVATVELAEREMPPTIHALLAARIERLRPEERTALERASVIGKQFSNAALEHLLPANLRADLDPCLEALRRRELIERDTGWFLGDPVYRFHHVLIRDAAYRRLLKGSRAELHVQFADWLEARAGDTLADHDETLGWHLEQSHQHLRELGPLDESGRACGARAVRHLAAAGRRALARDDVAAAAGLLGRAIECAEPTDDERADLALDWCEALLAAGDVDNARTAVDELAQSIGGSARLRAWHACFAAQLAVLTAPQHLRETAGAVSEAADTLAAAGDDAGEAKARWVHALALGAARRGRRHGSGARTRAGRRAQGRRPAPCECGACRCAARATRGTEPGDAASGRCLDVVRVLRITAGAPAVEAVALRCQAVLEALRSRTDAARRMIGASRRIVEDLGVAPRLLETEMFAGMVELLASEPLDAERHLRASYDGFRSRGLRVDAAQAAALLGRALLDQGRAAEAEALSHESEELAGDDLKAGIAWRGVRAEALARGGEHEAALQLARDAVALASATDALLDHADARVALAVALRAAGHPEEAAAENARAMELWEAKGATHLVERARGTPHDTVEAVRAPSGPSEIDAYFANLATRAVERTIDALNAGDWPAFVALVAPVYVLEDRTRFSSGIELDRERYVAMNRGVVAGGMSWAVETIATRGQHLSLHHARWNVEYGPIGLSQNELLTLDEVDDEGRRCHAVHFDTDDLDAAYAELDARGGTDESHGHAQAVAAQDWAGFRALLADDHVLLDYRPLGWGTLRGPDAYVEMIRGLAEITHELRLVTYHRVRHGQYALSVAATTGRGEGGRFENPLVNLREYDDAGRIRRHEMYALDEFARARERFESLCASLPGRSSVETHGFDNDVTENFRRIAAAYDNNDWAAFVDTLAPGAMSDDRRARVTLRGEDLVQAARVIWENASIVWQFDVVATRGQRLGLAHVRMSGTDHADGPFDDEHYSLAEVDDDGRRVHTIAFAPDDLDAAYEELDARYPGTVDPETARHVEAARAHTDAVAAQDWEALAAMHTADLVVEDHRPVGWGTLHGVDAYLELMRSLGSLARDLTFPVHHRLNDRHMTLVAVTMTGEGDGGPFEMATVGVFERDERGRLRRWDVYDPDQLAEAKTHFDAACRTGAGTSTVETHGFDNKATDFLQRFVHAFDTRNWPGVVATLADHSVFDDRRSLNRFEVWDETALEATRLLFDRPTIVWHFDLLASRGARLALCRLRQSGTDRMGGTFEGEHLSLTEVDDSGRRIATILFGLDDIDAAYYELDDRFAAGEAAGASLVWQSLRTGMRAYATDMEALEQEFPPEFSVTDHRPLGWGTLDRASYLDLARATEKLSDARRNRVQHALAVDPRGAIIVSQLEGVADGAPFELSSVIVSETLPDGRPIRLGFYALDRLDDAWARYREITRGSALPFFENAATRSVHAYAAAWNARDWDGVVAVYSPRLLVDDRRSGSMIEVDADQYFEATRPGFDLPDSTWTVEIVATRGKRLCLTRDRWVGAGGAVDTSEVELLGVIEVDDDGRQVHRVSFDADQLDAAYEELDDLFAAGEASVASAVWQKARNLVRAYGRDHEAFARELPTEFWAHNHRPLGWGTLDRATYLDMVRATSEMTELQTRTRHALAINPRGTLSEVRSEGVLTDGGPFELASLIVGEILPDGRPIRLDFYALDCLDDAWARYHEIINPRVLIPPNAATRATDRHTQLFERRDWDAVRELFAEGLVYDDRRYGTVGDRETMLASNRLVASAGTTVVRTLLATAGDRLTLEHYHWVAGREGAQNEGEHLSLNEVDAEGRITAIVSFNVDDRRAANDELQARYAAGEGREVLPPVAFDYLQAIKEHDLESARALVADDCVLDDRRRVGLGGIEGRESWVNTLATVWAQAPDAVIETIRHVAVEPHGFVAVVRLAGTVASGDMGAFESFFVSLTAYRDGKVALGVMYELEELDVAVRRLEELRPGVLGLPPNAAVQVLDRIDTAMRIRDWTTIRELCAEKMVFEDRRTVARTITDRNSWVDSYQFAAEHGTYRVQPLGSSVSGSSWSRCGGSPPMSAHLFSSITSSLSTRSMSTTGSSRRSCSTGGTKTQRVPRQGGASSPGRERRSKQPLPRSRLTVRHSTGAITTSFVRASTTASCCTTIGHRASARLSALTRTSRRCRHSTTLRRSRPANSSPSLRSIITDASG